MLRKKLIKLNEREREREREEKVDKLQSKMEKGSWSLQFDIIVHPDFYFYFFRSLMKRIRSDFTSSTLKHARDPTK